MIARTTKRCVKRLIGTRAYSALYFADRRLRIAYHIAKSDLLRVLVRRTFGREEQIQQACLTWSTEMPGFSDSSQFVQFLQDNGIKHQEGCFIIYVPPQQGLQRLLGDLVNFYPKDSGFKFLKDLSGPDESRYTGGGRQLPWEQRMLPGKPSDQLRDACALELLGLGARIYDLTEVLAGQTRMTCFVVQHVNGKSPSMEKGAKFLADLDAVVRSGILGVAVPYAHSAHVDFSQPSFNGNLLEEVDGTVKYIDFQHFLLKDRTGLINSLLAEGVGDFQFGDVHFLRKGRPYVYQTIPGLTLTGKRDSTVRWTRIRKMLADADIAVRGRLVLDICCNSGVMSAFALAEGAGWALGWDLPPVADMSRKVLKALGFTRFNIYGRELNEDYALLADIDARLAPRLSGCVVLYLAARRHIGLLQGLKAIDWRALVFEGHEREGLEEMRGVVDFMDAHGAHLAERCTCQDGDSEPRPLLLFLRRHGS